MAPEIDEFAQRLIQHVRDLTIQANDRTMSEDHAIADRWREAAATGSPETLATTLIPDVVDSAMFYLLYAIDEGLLKLSYTASNGKVVDLSSQGLGELAGLYMASDEWRPQYAKERFIDDFADLK